MVKRTWNVILGLLALMIGGLLYVVFREKTYIGIATEECMLIVRLRELFGRYNGSFFKFYFPDLLWAFSLACGLQVIHTHKQPNGLNCGIAAFGCGCVWELMQYCEIVSGTGDILDMVMYFLGSALCVIINLGEREK